MYIKVARWSSHPSHTYGSVEGAVRPTAWARREAGAHACNINARAQVSGTLVESSVSHLRVGWRVPSGPTAWARREAGAIMHNIHARAG